MSGLFGLKKNLPLFTRSAPPVLGLKGGCGKPGGVDQIGIRDGEPAEADLLRSRDIRGTDEDGVPVESTPA